MSFYTRWRKLFKNYIKTRLNPDILVSIHHKTTIFIGFITAYFDQKKIIKKIFKTAFYYNTQQIKAKKQINITNIANTNKKLDIKKVINCVDHFLKLT